MQTPAPRKPRHPASVYLRRYTALKLQRDDLKEELAEIRRSATRATSRLTAERVSGTSRRDSMANAAVKAVEVEQRLDRIIANLEEALDARLFILEQMPDEWEKAILVKRYIKGMSWKEIQRCIPFGQTGMYKLHGMALEHFWKIYRRQNEIAK